MYAFSATHPAVLLLYYAAVLLITMFTAHPVLLAISLLCSVGFYAWLERPRVFVRQLAFSAVLFLLIALSNPLFSHNGATPLFFLNGHPITREAVLCGMNIAAMLMSALYWFRCCHQTLTSEKWLYLFGHITPKLALLLSSALRFIPLLRRQAQTIRAAQKAMGRYSSRTYIERVKSSMHVFSALMTWSLENAIDTGASMKARGYGLKHRSHFSLFRFSKRDAFLLALVLILCGATLLGALVQRPAFVFYPQVSSVAVDARAIMGYAAYAALCCLPLITEGKERAQWTYYRSKM